MVEKEILIQPMDFHGPGDCPKCYGPLTVIDSELTMMSLNTDGIPLDEETTIIRCEGVCPQCGTRLPMMRWKGGYIPFSEIGYLIKRMELEDEANRRVEEMNSKSKGKNPFALTD